MKTKFSGLYLWSVDITYQYGCSKSARGNYGLWVVTPTNSLTAAAIKARQFLKKNREYPHAKITTIKDSGTIDA